ncbi:MAG: AMP-binding protein [Gemmatimonadetes bacterium]|jgi:acetyl-CoA synthetase|nr:AMP-binding protein [Gemmatimonadota bacterium]MBT7864595.1 AMP-binding protein [Gemmatimonadota bacterium]
MDTDMNTDPASLDDVILWTPSPEDISRSNLKAFMDAHGIATFDELMDRSTSDVAWFTDALLKFLDIRFSTPYERAVDVDPADWRRPVWCPGGRMNITASCVDRWLESEETAERLALIAELENGEVRELTYAELAAQVARCANALTELGLGHGDRIGLYMPMTWQIGVALLAVARIGAVALPLFSGFGAGAVRQRLLDAEASALLTADGFHRRGKVVPLKPLADEAVACVPSLRHQIVLKLAGNDVEMTTGRDHWWHDVVDPQSPEHTAADTSAEDPLMIIYTSGTTGRPKGAVHTHCGFPVKGAQDMCFGMDVHPGERIYWVTDMGWMMGPWLIFGATALGGTAFVYEGAPDYPGPGRVWELAERHQLQVIGLSPTLARALRASDDPAAGASGIDLSSLRMFASTGEPWNPEPFRWLFETVGQSKRPIINYTGGTEISGGILQSNPLLPFKAASFSAACPGMAVDVVDEEGRSLLDDVGELAIRTPWIGMTRGFWRDEGDERYQAAYWSKSPGIWIHGDWARRDADGQWWILGRSDDTINVAGKRVGPAEFESVLVSHSSVVEAAAIGVPHPLKGSDVVCFCLVADGAAGEDLAEELGQLCSSYLGRPLRPGRILFVEDLPKTRNAKVMRRVVRATYLSEDPGDTSSLVNPDSIDAIRRASQPS